MKVLHEQKGRTREGGWLICRVTGTCWLLGLATKGLGCKKALLAPGGKVVGLAVQMGLFFDCETDFLNSEVVFACLEC